MATDLKALVAANLAARPLTALKAWLLKGIATVVCDGTGAAEAFDPGLYVVGAVSSEDWRQDLVEIVERLPRSARVEFDEALVQCLEELRTDPSEDAEGGRRSDADVAVVLLWLARNLECHPVNRCLHILVTTKFPRSQAVFDEALWTWRLLVPTLRGTEFIEAAVKDLSRFRREYAPSLFIGMCLADLPGQAVSRRLALFPELREYLYENAAVCQSFQAAFRSLVVDQLSSAARKALEAINDEGSLPPHDRVLLLGERLHGDALGTFADIKRQAGRRSVLPSARHVVARFGDVAQRGLVASRPGLTQ